MGTRKDTHKVGAPSKPRGQQTGYAGNPDQNREEMKKTPALRGRLKKGSEMFGDASEQHIAADAVTPSTNSPSTVVKTASKNKKRRLGDGGTG